MTVSSGQHRYLDVRAADGAFVDCTKGRSAAENGFVVPEHESPPSGA
jgi:hypothetical protein